MSIPVGLERLREEAARFGSAPYLLSVSSDGSPHATAIAASWSEAALVAKIGKRTASNVAERPRVSLLWPPPEAGGYSLIVDGTAGLEGVGDELRVRITPTRGVLHRPATAPPAPGSTCSADCVPLLR
jgi:hypothetical protein